MKTSNVVVSLFLGLQVVLVGCASTSPQKARGFPFSSRQAEVSGATAPGSSTDTSEKSSTSPESTDKAKKSGEILKSTPAQMQTGIIGAKTQEPETEKSLSDPQKQKIVLNFDKADVVEVTNQIFGEYLKFNYVLDPAVRGQISLYLDGEYTKQELLQLITRAYNAANIDIVPQKGMYHIQTMQRSPSSRIPIADQLSLKEDKYGIKPVIIIYRLRYLDANQAMNTIKYFLTPGRSLGADPLTNTIMMVEDTANARTIIEVLKTIDINILKEIGMEIVQLKTMAPDVAVQNVETLMGKLDVFKSSKISSNVALLPLPQLGAVLIMAQSQEFLKTAREWLITMDLQGQEAGEQVHVHFIENGLARDIANILGQLYGLNISGGDGGPSQRIVSSRRGGFGQSGQSGMSSGFGQGSLGTGSFGSGTGQRSSSGFSTQTGSTQSPFSQSSTGSSTGIGSSSQRSSGIGGQRTVGTGARGVGGFSTQTAAGGGTAGQVSTSMTGLVSIIPDEVNNAIVIKANAADYARLKATIQALDIVPRAVLIELMVAEITLTDDLQYGLEYYFKNKGMDIGGTKGRQSTFVNNNLGIANAAIDSLSFAAAPGFNMFWTSVAGDISYLVRLLSSETHVSILANPTLLAMDNQEASLTVGGREPILSQQSVNTASDNTIVNSVQYEETGLILNVTPHVNSGGLVRMEVEQTIRTANRNNVSGIDSPSFNERHIQTSLLSQDNKTAVIGGIIQQTDNVGSSGVPFLRKVPLVAPLFSTSNKTTTRTELIIAITPHVVRQGDHEATRQFLYKLKQLKQQIDTGL